MRRSLIHYRRTHLAVICGAAVTTAVLTGALMVGDSLRGSLRDLTLDRLGDVDWAVVGERPFRQSLAAELGAAIGAAPAPLLTVRASATEPESGARASKVALWGVDERFFGLYPETDEPEAQPPDLATRRGGFPAAAVNRSLAVELGISPGSQLVLAFQRPSDVPRETVVGRAESGETIELLRVTVARVLADRGPGGFGLEPRQTRALNVFVDLERLQRAVLGRGSQRLNVLLGGASPEDEAATERVGAALRRALTIEDLGLILRRHGPALSVQSRQFVLDDAVTEVITQLARDAGVPAQPVLTYLANSLTGGDRSIPYSTVSALDPSSSPSLDSFRLVDGSPVPPLTSDEILLNEWAAADLEASIGDAVEIDYYTLGPRDELATANRTLRLRGVVAMDGVALDPFLTPEFPGIEDADDISEWNPPFPVDLERIRPRDEEYWDRYRTAPKAFVSLELGRELWRSRFGSLTSVRLGMAADTTVAQIEGELGRRLDPRGVGLTVRALRREGLRAARGATDFAGLFVGLSLFLIVSAALLAGLLFRLGVERRAAEVGLLRATGFPAKVVRRRFLSEGLVLAAIGTLLGLAGGAAYAWALLAGLRSWWLPAIGEPVLFLHVSGLTLLLGGVISLAVVGLAIAVALRRLRQVSIVALLAGVATVARKTRSRRPLAFGIGSLAVAGALTVAALSVEARAAAGLAFGVGAALLSAGVSSFAHYGGRRPASANSLGGGGAALMAARNSARSRTRSLLCVTLMACASFVIVVVAANRLHGEVDVADPGSGAGGFTLAAETDVPIYGDLADESEAVATALDGSEVIPFRLLPGEDVSCLNLYQPERPRILGAPPEMVTRGGFGFQQTSVPRANPWQLLDEPLEEGVVPALGDYNSVLWILHSGLGEDLVVENERGDPIRLRFVGLLAKSLFQSEVVISEADFERHFPSRSGYSYFLLDPEPGRAAEVASALEKDLARFGFDAVPTGERLAAFQAVENTYLSTFQTLGGLGLLLGTVGMGIILLRNVLERRAELATLRAIGYRRARLRGLVLMENALLLVVGLAVGAVAGAAATAPHLATVGQPLPWISLGLTLLAVFAIGMTSSILAVRTVARMPLLASLRSR